MEETKTCCRCGKAKQLELFVAKRKCCKECHNIRNREWRSDNTELNREIQRGYYYNVVKPKNQNNHEA